jgi:hypothetical protein
MKPHRRRLAGLSYSNVMSTIAVVVAIGTGSAYAAATIGSPEVIDESLTSVDVKNASLTGGDVADSSLTGADVLNGSLAGTDIKDSTIVSKEILNDSLTDADLAQGSVRGNEVADDSLGGDDIDEQKLGNVPSASHAASAQSASHATTAGDAPIKGYQVIWRQAQYDGLVKKEQTVDVPCPAGKRPIGGGGMAYTGANSIDGNEVAIVESMPYGGYTYGPDDNRPEAWRVKAQATDRASYASFIYITAYAVCAKTDMP